MENPLGDPKVAELIQYFSQNICKPTPVNVTDLAYDLHDLALLKEEIKVCARKNKRSYSYFAGILKIWRANEIKSYADFLEKE